MVRDRFKFRFRFSGAICADKWTSEHCPTDDVYEPNDIDLRVNSSYLPYWITQCYVLPVTRHK